MVKQFSPEGIAKSICADPAKAEHHYRLLRAAGESELANNVDVVSLYENLLQTYYCYRDGKGMNDKQKSLVPYIKKYFTRR